MPLDVYETSEGLAIEAAVSGFTKGQIQVALEGSKLTIKAESGGETQSQGESEGRPYFLRERHHGTLSRSLLIGARATMPIV